VAVQSHWFSVGSVVSWARAGVGAVATQSIAEPAYGPRALALLEGGMSPPEALAQLVAADPEAAVRQVAVIGAGGEVAAHTGAGCIPFAGHVTGHAVSCQANMMASETVWPAMLDAFERSSGRRLSDRLLATLVAAEREGGDVRGRQSAALVVVAADGEPWERVVELRVEDHTEPLVELSRLLRLSDAYRIASEADELSGRGEHASAATLYRQATELAPESDELRFWAGLGAAQAGDLDAGVEQVNQAIAAHGGWRDLLERLPPELAPSAAAVLGRMR
jgi:uncharacterized Ntn-hydrolase superfamily protein